MIIFGWGGGKAKNHGPAVAQVCSSCGREGFLNYFTITKWFRLYFIPIIPYKTRHFLACPVCTSGTELTTIADRQRVQALVATTASLGTGQQPRSAFGQGAPAPALPPAPTMEKPIAPSQPPSTSNRIRAGESWSG